MGAVSRYLESLWSGAVLLALAETTTVGLALGAGPVLGRVEPGGMYG